MIGCTGEKSLGEITISQIDYGRSYPAIRKMHPEIKTFDCRAKEAIKGRESIQCHRFDTHPQNLYVCLSKDKKLEEQRRKSGFPEQHG